jgi:HAE1 family hydrophobic/amphiphilic exporter-1
MLISDFAIKRPIVTIVSMLALVVFGLISLAKLQTDEFRSRRRSPPSAA